MRILKEPINYGIKQYSIKLSLVDNVRDKMLKVGLSSKVTPKVKNTKQLFLRRDSSLVSLSFAA